MLQNVPVLASGQVTGQKEWKPAIVPTVTMALTPADAEMLVQAGHSGDLRLLLRSDADTETPTAVNTVSKKRLPWGDHRAHSTPSVAAAQQKPRHSVTIIDGGVRTVKEFLLP
jgi:pilus assembly protein CpaB